MVDLHRLIFVEFSGILDNLDIPPIVLVAGGLLLRRIEDSQDCPRHQLDHLHGAGGCPLPAAGLTARISRCHLYSRWRAGAGWRGHLL